MISSSPSFLPEIVISTLHKHVNYYVLPFTQLDTQEKVMALLPVALRVGARWIAPAAATASLATGFFILILLTESHAIARDIFRDKVRDNLAYESRKQRELFLAQFLKRWFKAYLFTSIPTILCASLFTYFRTLAARSVCLFSLHIALSERKTDIPTLIRAIYFGCFYRLLLPFSASTCIAASLAKETINRILDSFTTDNENERSAHPYLDDPLPFPSAAPNALQRRLPQRPLSPPEDFRRRNRLPQQLAVDDDFSLPADHPVERFNPQTGPLHNPLDCPPPSYNEVIMHERGRS